MLSARQVAGIMIYKKCTEDTAGTSMKYLVKYGLVARYVTQMNQLHVIRRQLSRKSGEVQCKAERNLKNESASRIQATCDNVELKLLSVFKQSFSRLQQFYTSCYTLCRSIRNVALLLCHINLPRHNMKLSSPLYSKRLTLPRS
jgi:hypothetical protein